MLEIVDGDPSGRGMVRAHAVIQLGDPGAESAQESAVRFVLLRAGLPQPRTQVEIGTRLGTFWADLGWEEWRVLLEYDGRVKYQDQDSLIREKRRQDAVTEAGWRSLRVTREDLRGADLLVARTLRLLPAAVPLTRRPLLRGR
jgi:very-short-patch-repair endonuclease